MNKFIRYFKGWVQFELTGDFISDFFQNLSEYNISIWDTNKTSKIITAKSNIGDYKLISKIAKKSKNKTRIIKKYGFPFKKYKYRKRTGILIGICISLFLLVFSQNFIWEIKFPEYDEKKLEYLKHEMNQYGIKIGANYHNLDFKNIQQNILKENQNLSRISFNRKGTTLEVELSPRDKNNYINHKDPCNVVSDKTAQIVSIDNYSGVKEVKPKEVVMPGDILISGKELLPDGGYKAIHADGKIIANIYYNYTISFSFNQKEKKIIDNKKRYSLQILNLKLPLYVNFKLNDNYDITTNKKQLTIFGIKLPIYLNCDKYEIYEIVDKIYTDNEAIEKIKKSFDEYETNELKNSNILEKNDTINKSEDKISITRKYIVQQEIGKKELLSTSN